MTEPRTLRELIGKIATTVVELAITRSNLRSEEGADELDEESIRGIAEDAWNACQGIDTCDETPIPELLAAERTIQPQDYAEMVGKVAEYDAACELLPDDGRLPLYGRIKKALDAKSQPQDALAALLQIEEMAFKLCGEGDNCRACQIADRARAALKSAR